ncbi:hypothetical protein BXY39_0456 [Eilatimonas milleporae]|uniref:Uncharacterized protein n=1 Tax=Eilatimonas milleporae TaxID=911205 RepID=A0A3M0CR57_9PROT|nr:hypothetical protein BXY39_0456 [Eilatimonas milleporae]
MLIGLFLDESRPWLDRAAVQKPRHGPLVGSGWVFKA